MSEGQEIVAHYPDFIKNKPTTIKDTTRMSFIGGGKDAKRVLTGVVARQDISLIEREMDEIYVENWRAMKKAGLPVPPTLRISSSGSLLVTDVKRDGSEVYGKAFLKNIEYSRNRPEERPNPEVDQYFIRLTEPSSLENIVKEAERLVLIATGNYIVLPETDPLELVISPDGKWKLMMLDLVAARVVNRGTNKDLLQDLNNQLIQVFLRNLKLIRNELLEPKPQ